MNQEKHLSSIQLSQLLNSDQQDEVPNDMRLHLEKCAQCQGGLNSMAAKSETWTKASIYLRAPQASHAEIRWSPFSGADSENGEAGSVKHGNVAGRNDVWQFNPSDIMEPPRHPEMLGRLGKFDIERELGRGGMGIVFKAFDHELHRPLAIKVLAPHLASHAGARQRFAQEAIAAAGILHPNVIAVHGVNHQGKVPYLVMSYVDGISLQEAVEREGPLYEIDIVRIALQIVGGLGAAHSQGLVHRDIKPANILIESEVNRVVITDFGLARAEDDVSLTQTGWLAGTPNYMSPEQTRGRRADHRSDLFSLGSLIYFLATGRLPFRAETPLAVLERIKNDTPTPICEINRQISSTLNQIVERLHEKSPEFRFQSAGELHDLLQMQLSHLHQPHSIKAPEVRSSSSQTKRLNSLVGCLIDRRSLLAFVMIAVVSCITGWLLWDSWVPNFFASPRHANLSKGENYTLLSLNPARGIRLIQNGINYVALGRFDEAIDVYEEASFYPWCTGPANFQLACVSALDGDSEKALGHLEIAIDRGFVEIEALDTSDLDSIRDEPLFSVLQERQRAMRRAIELTETRAPGASPSDFAEVESTFLDALRRDSTNEEAIINLSFLTHWQGRYGEAFRWHLRASKIPKYGSIGHYNLGCYYALQGESDLAFEELDKSLDLKVANVLSPDLIENDADLEFLRSDSRYSEFLNRFKNAHAEMLQDSERAR